MIPPERQTAFSLHDGQTRSPMNPVIKSLLHIRQLRGFLMCTRSESGFLVLILRVSSMPLILTSFSDAGLVLSLPLRPVAFDEGQYCPNFTVGEGI